MLSNPMVEGIRAALSDRIAFFDNMGCRAADHGLPAALLVDKGNPKAERLYRSIGFEYVEDAMWGGHEMRRLRK